MRSRVFGPTSHKVPVVGQGTWQVAERGAGATRAVQALRLGISLGLTHIDTAEMYGSGRAEELVAEAIAGIPRDSLFLVSKVLPQNASFRGTIKACEASLRRLKTEYLDVYLLHWRSNHPIEETMGALERLVDDGKIRALGVSNFDVAEMDAARSALRRHPLACNQVLYHLRERAIEHAVIPWCEQHGVAVVAYSPFGHNDFPALSSKSGAVLQSIAQAHQATPRQVALSFLTRLPSVLAIPKASNADHAAENAAAGALELSGDEIAALDAAFPRGPKPRSLPML